MNVQPDIAGEAATLRERARLLAKPRSAQQEACVREDFLEFHLAQERYALEASAVQDVQPLKQLTELPGTPDFLAGVVSVQGKLVAVIDLKRFLDLPLQGVTDLHSIILLKSAQLRIGLLADQIVGLHSIDTGSIQKEFLPAGIQKEFLRGVTADRLAVIDAAAVLGDPRLIVDDEVGL